MKRLLLVLTLCVIASLVRAQSSEIIWVKAGEDATNFFTASQRYRYSNFIDGILFYPQGKRSGLTKLNFDMLSGTMHFIDREGDTLSIAEDSNIFKYVQLKNDLYYHDFAKGYFEILTRGESTVRLLSQHIWKVLRTERVIDNGYGSTSTVGSTEYSSRRSNDTNAFVHNDNCLFGKDRAYYLLGKREKIFKATRSNFMKLFPDQKQKIQNYLRDQEVEFSNEDHLRKLLEFCLNLENTSA